MLAVDADVAALEAEEAALDALVAASAAFWFTALIVVSSVVVDEPPVPR